MRKIRIIEHISLDGVIQHSADDSDFPYGEWTVPYRTPAGRDAVLAMYGQRFDLLLGRRTYDIWSGFWPKAPSSPMAAAINAATKYVATHRPASLAWGPFESLGTGLINPGRPVVPRMRPAAEAGPPVSLFAHRGGEAGLMLPDEAPEPIDETSSGTNIVEDLRRIHSQDGADLILSGSSTLTSTLLEHGLADEIVLFVYPVQLGRGKRIFAEGTPARAFELTSTNALPSGIAIHVYKAAGPLKNQPQP